MRVRGAAMILTAVLLSACGGGASLPAPAVVTFPISALGAEGEILVRQLDRFMAQNPGIKVVQRITPDAADQKHQLYVQWLNAGASDPDVLQLDVIWTPEFAAAGWILPLDQFAPETSAFFPSTIAANQWKDSLYALPWFIDVGMLYWRTDLMDTPPANYADLVRESQRAMRAGRTRYGYVWQGARYEGLVANFVEYIGAHGGTILEGGRVVLNSNAGFRALREMLSQIYQEEV
ncbi:MAG TPA: extracellular solute-binding protein, partial [Gemmatimonadales bacterium]|nr:extracellular solute-binding protein [Gemmatimonadales bacterium]